MTKYKITVVDEVNRTYYVEAKSEDHALQWDCEIIDVKDHGTECVTVIEIEEW